MPETGTTLRDEAFRKIKERIVQGEWGGGTFLSERRLSETLQMSKTPIRSALDRLEMMGLVKLMPNQGFVVQEISLRKIMDIYELRLSLETFAVGRLTGNMDRAFFGRLDENLDKQTEAAEREDIVGYVELDRQFHEAIIAGLANEEYADAMSRIQDKFLMAVRTTFYKNKSRLWGSLEEHREIRDALAGNDPSRSERLIRDHIEFVKQIML
ncbi:GntR family transcriptional regulator [Cohnella hashimotonis]|uniref:GntR family transcriptional regulator n=1 Tax=Cohnella hashimotonis TaxID=2826895 RepID=A0ABT6TNG5_9BACL|nr:GntR family transcriptional regulator [Cohnella hashimotonis]MDI4648397.1 GntR family transcriptional regulator [Cohnella hashimotonis]